MRRLLSFACEGAPLGASLDEAESGIGLLVVTGGSQTRVGSHRIFERLCNSLSKNGYPSFRFDRRGVGDSGGEDPGFRASGPDLRAALAAFREEEPRVHSIVALGLCDGATALALHAAGTGLSGLILINPWLVEAEAGEPAPAAIRSHYRRRLTSAEGWKKLLTGQIKLGRLLSGLRRAASTEQSSLAADVAKGLGRAALPTALILAAGDNTAIAAAQEVKAPAYNGLIHWRQEVDTDSHTFAKPGDGTALLAAVLEALATLVAD
jgi:exosortase A-associated hydrolase 1